MSLDRKQRRAEKLAVKPQPDRDVRLDPRFPFKVRPFNPRFFDLKLKPGTLDLRPET